MSDTINSTLRVSFHSSLIIIILALTTFAVAYFTPPLSGPFCEGSCFLYPYLDTVSRFPRDYFWMYPAIALFIVYIVWMASLHQYAVEGKKVYSLAGFSFGVVSAAILIVDYFLQLSVIQIGLLNGEMEGISMLSQYNPHGVFIALEDIGYLLMAVAFLCMAPIFSGSKIENAVRWTFVAGSILTVFMFALIVLQYGIYREYRFEIAAISINWMTLIISGVLLSFVFNRKSKEKEHVASS